LASHLTRSAMPEQRSWGPPGQPEDPAKERLDSWKEIAAHFKRGVTTVQRWEQQEGLPVHRHPHAKRGSVYAFKVELDRWWQNGQHRLSAEESEAGAQPTPGALQRRWLRWVIGLVAGLGLGAAVWVRSAISKSTPPSREVPLTTFEGHETFPAISPDGRQVAFVWDGGTATAPAQLYVQLVGIGDPLQLTRGRAGVSHPAWSPDGRQLAFLRRSTEGPSDVVVIPALGGPERRLTSTLCVACGLSWSPDGKVLAVPDKGSPNEPDGLFLVSAETATKSRLTSSPAQATWMRGDSRPAFSPDGRSLAFLRSESFVAPDIYLISVAAGGAPTRIVRGFRRISSLDWTADGRSLVFAGGGTPDGLWRVSDRGGEPQALPMEAGGQVTSVSIARSAARLAYSREVHDFNIWRVKGPTGEGDVAPIRLIASTRQDSFPSYSPDGTQIAFQSDRSGRYQVWSCASDGGNCRQLTSDGGNHPAWSPDGRKIAFSCGFADDAPGVCVIEADGSSQNRLTPAVTVFGHSWRPSWSSDGRWIYFTRPVGLPRIVQVWRIPAGGGDPQQLTKGGGNNGRESSDGRFVYYSKRPGQVATPLWRVPTVGGEEALVLDRRPHFMNWSLWRENIVYVNDGEDGATIEVFDPRTRTIREIAALGRDAPPVLGLSVSPDGKWIVYGRDDVAGSDLMLIDGFR
jgi:Tol biopolymer transport system component